MMREIVLTPLCDEDALNLLFDVLEREITHDELDPSTKGIHGIGKRVYQEDAFREC